MSDAVSLTTDGAVARLTLDRPDVFLALPATSVGVAKRLLAFGLSLDALRAAMEAGFAVCLASDEHRAGMDATRARLR